MSDARTALDRVLDSPLEPEVRAEIQTRLDEGDAPGAALPSGPFSLVALMGVLHHVPGRETRAALVAAAADRLAPGGLLALTLWRFAGRPRRCRSPIAARKHSPSTQERGSALTDGL